MKFLSGLLKTLSILIIIVSTMICTAVSVAADVLEAYLVMGGVLIGCILVALNIWGTGMALSEIVKLRKKVAELEQRNPVYYPGMQRPAAAAPQQPDLQQTQPIPQVTVRPAAPVMPPQAPAAKAGIQKWLPAIIGGGIGLVIVIAVAVILLLSGGDKGKENNFSGNSEPSQVEATPEPSSMEAPEETVSPDDIVVEEWQAMLESGEITPDELPEDVKKVLIEAGILPSDEGEAPSNAPAAATVELDQPFGTDFVEFNFTKFAVEKDIKHSVKTGHVTRTTGPDPIDGQQYVLLEGTIVNTSKSPLTVYDFYAGRYVIDGYTYDLNSSNCDILTAEGQTVSEIDPLMEYKIRIYVAIPDKLADDFSACDFFFGFYDGFDNQDLSYNRSFSDDAVAACPYQFQILGMK